MINGGALEEYSRVENVHVLADWLGKQSASLYARAKTQPTAGKPLTARSQAGDERASGTDGAPLMQHDVQAAYSQPRTRTARL